jgi:hypothetical protein
MIPCIRHFLTIIFIFFKENVDKIYYYYFIQLEITIIVKQKKDINMINPP